MSDNDYSNNVFINCPFDPDYNRIFEAIVFAIHDCGFIPRCAKEEDEEVRIIKIGNLIEECKYGIHDISRTDPDDTGLPRFNMPFELGLFAGCKRFGDIKKSYLVLDIEEHRYERFISDIKGIDVKAHHDNARNAVGIVRDWLRNVSRRTSIPDGTTIWNRYGIRTEELD